MSRRLPNQTANRVNTTKFLCAEALRPAMDVLIPQFWRIRGYGVTVDYANVGVITERLRRGEVADLAIVSPEQWERLRQEDRLLPDVRASLAKIGIAVAVRAGVLKPNVSSISALKQALLEAHAIAIIDPAKGSPSGVRGLKLFDRLGIAAELRPKLKLVETSEDVFKVLATGEADLGINQASEVAASPYVESVGPLPVDAQLYTAFVAGVPRTALQADIAKRFVEFLMSPNAAAEFKAKEIEIG